MAPPITLNFNIVDNFPIYELDGITKHTGETAFTIAIWHNGVVRIPMDAAVVEIGTSGEYKFSFTALDVGYWTWEVTNTYNDDVYGGSQLVSASNVKFEMTASDNGVTSSFGIWMTKDGVRVTDLTGMSLTAHTSDGTLINTFTPGVSCTTEGVFTFSCSASKFSSDVEYYLSMTATRSTTEDSWSSNLGFTKV